LLYNYYQLSDNNGAIGVIITVLIYAGLLILNCFIFYNYLVFLHKEGRIIDIYARVNAETSNFFIPLDNEISSRYLRWIITKIQLENRNAKTIEDTTKHISITYNDIQDPHIGYIKNITHVSIYKRSI